MILRGPLRDVLLSAVRTFAAQVVEKTEQVCVVCCVLSGSKEISSFRDFLDEYRVANVVLNGHFLLRKYNIVTSTKCVVSFCFILF